MFCRLQCRDETQDFEEVYHGSTTQFRVHGLEAGSSYHLRVQAANTVGRGEWSAESSFATTRLPPQPPCKLECSVDADPLQRWVSLLGLTMPLCWAAAAAESRWLGHVSCASVSGVG